jgi:nitrite reductase (NADH) small subunit
MGDTHGTINLGSVNRIPLGQGRCYVVGSQEIAIFRQRDGQLFATANRCPHRQGPLSEGILGGGRIICPLHAHRFELADGAGSEPEECVRVYPVKIAEGEILLRLTCQISDDRAEPSVREHTARTQEPQDGYLAHPRS